MRPAVHTSMEQRYQDLALLAMSRLAEEHSPHCYGFSWKDGALIIRPRIGLEEGYTLVVTDKGIEGVDAGLAAVIEKTIVSLASPNDARDIGAAHAIAGRPPVKGATAAYHTGYDLALKYKKTTD